MLSEQVNRHYTIYELTTKTWNNQGFIATLFVLGEATVGVFSITEGVINSLPRHIQESVR